MLLSYPTYYMHLQKHHFTCAVDNHVHAGVGAHDALHQARHVALFGDVGRHAQRRARAPPRRRRRSQGVGGRCKKKILNILYLLIKLLHRSLPEPEHM